MHTCFPSILAKVFRLAPPTRPRPAADFLNPSLRRHSRHFDTSRSRKAWPYPFVLEKTIEHGTERGTTFRSRIRRPHESRIRYPAEWADNLNEHISAGSVTPEHEAQIPAIELASYVASAQELAEVNILSYIGLELKEWDKVLSLINRVLREVPPDNVESQQEFDPLQNVGWPIYELDKATGYWQRRGTGGLNAYIKEEGATIRSLDEFTESAPSDLPAKGVRNQFLGVLWRTLGDMMIAAASSKPDPRIMVVSREVIATLHHLNIIPGTLYRYPEPSSLGFPQQPSLLNEFEMLIMPSLADAAWKSQYSPAHAAAERNSAQYFMGLEIPRTRFKSEAPSLGPEIWMELILWSCIHGGWTFEGIDTILKATSVLENRWSILNWDEFVEERQREAAQISPPKKNLRPQLERKITSQVIASLIDRAIDDIQAAPASRGHPASQVVSRVCRLKETFERDQISMKSAPWDTFLVRCLEPEGVLFENDPQLALDVAGLNFTLAGVDPKDRDTRDGNTRESSSAAIGVYHAILGAQSRSGNPWSSVKILARLLDLVDLNQRLVVERFFQTLKQIDPVQFHTTDLLDFTSNTNRASRKVPGLDALLPNSITGPLLDLATDTNDYEFGRWLLYSNEVNGPLIKYARFADFRLASSIIRFGNATGDSELIRQVLVMQRWLADKKSRPIGEVVLSSYLRAQLSNRKQDSVENVLDTFSSSGSAPRSDVVAAIASQLLLQYAERGVSMDIFLMSSELVGTFTRLKSGVYGRLSRPASLDLNVILAILVTVDPDWTIFAKGKWTRAGQLPLLMDVNHFNIILEGIANAYGPIVAVRVLNKWCAPQSTEQAGLQGSRLPERPMEAHVRPPSTIHDTYMPRPRVDLHQCGIPVVQFLSRFVPNTSTARIMMKTVVRANQGLPDDFSGSGLLTELRPIFLWAVATYAKYGFTADDLTREMRLMESTILGETRQSS